MRTLSTLLLLILTTCSFGFTATNNTDREITINVKGDDWWFYHPVTVAPGQQDLTMDDNFDENDKAYFDITFALDGLSEVLDFGWQLHLLAHSHLRFELEGGHIALYINNQSVV